MLKECAVEEPDTEIKTQQAVQAICAVIQDRYMAPLSAEQLAKYARLHIGRFGGVHCADELRPELARFAVTYQELWSAPSLQRDLHHVRKHLQDRPIPVQPLRNVSAQVGGAQIFIKREDLDHTGAHRLNHCVGFALLAKHMGEKKLIAETGAGQHEVALATAAAYCGLECEVHMGEFGLTTARFKYME